MTFRVRLENLNFPPNVIVGCNFLLVATLVYKYRASNEDDYPIIVRAEDGGRYSITDGRHRSVASIIAGRPDILCELEKEKP